MGIPYVRNPIQLFMRLMVKFQDILKVVAGVFVGFVLFLITVETEIEKLQIELSSIRRLTVELEEGLTELRELQNSNKVFEEEKEDVVL